MASVKHFYTYETNVKLRWMNRPIIEVLAREFTTRTYDYYIGALKVGAITVNHKIINPEYKLKSLDVIYHTIHCHEPCPPEIKIIKEEPNYFVINKPAGIPVHPAGGYFLYSVTKAIFPDKKVGCVNRLDVPVSGVLIITHKNHKDAYELLKDAKKIYISKVKGLFPDEIEVNEPIGTTNGRIHSIMEGGKECRTIFKRLAYENGYSLVECQPITGRTHQIRIHLSYLGFPVINDILYGKGESAINETKVPVNGSDENNLNQSKLIDVPVSNCDEDFTVFDDKDKYEFIIRNCKGETNKSFNIKDSHICLHAWKYVYNGQTYEAPWPEWAILN